MGAVPINYLSTPARVVNQAVDVLGQSGKIIGAITDGTPVAEAARRNYGQILRQLLRANHWPFARKMAQLTLLGDASGNSAAPVISQVEPPWTYAYEWPIDAVQGRWMPAGFPLQVGPEGGNPAPPGTNAQGNPAPWMAPLAPARFLVSSSNLYPVETGLVPWNQQPDLQRTEGVGPITRKTILTDICNAWFVYTRLVTVIEEWDDLFRQSMVSLLAIVLAPVAIDDVKVRLAAMRDLVAMAKMTIADARVAAGNEAGFPMSIDHTPAWISARNAGTFAPGLGGVSTYAGGTLGLYLPYEPFSLGGSVF